MFSFVKFISRNHLYQNLYNKVLHKEFSKLNFENIKRPFLNDIFVNRLNLDLLDYPEVNSENEMNHINNLTKNLINLISNLRDNNMKNNELWKIFADDGYLFANNLKFYGEFKMKNMQYVKLSENFNFNLSFALSVLVHEYIATDVISMLGSDNVKSKYLKLIGNGELQPVICLRESSRLKELVPDNFCTQAILSDDKKHYIINGSKTDLLNVDQSNLLIVVADIIDQDPTVSTTHTAAFIIDPNTAGISFSVDENCTLDNSKSYNLKLCNVSVSVENKISSGDVSIPRRMVSLENLFLSALSCGMHKSVLAKYCEHVNSREVFGVPLFSFDRIKNEIIDLCVDCFSSESACYYLAGQLDQDPSRDFLVESAVTKTFCVESLNQWTDNYMTILSHNGLHSDSQLKWQRDTRYLLDHQAPTVDVRLAIGRSCVGHLLKEYQLIEYNMIKTVLCFFGFYPDIICSNSDPTASSKISSHMHPRLAILTKKYTEQFRNLLLTLNELRAKHGEVLLNDNVFLYKLSEIMLNTWVFLTNASRVSRAVCLYIPTFKHQFGLVTRHYLKVEKRLCNDREDIINYFKNQTDANPMEMDLLLFDEKENKIIPHPFDI